VRLPPSPKIFLPQHTMFSSCGGGAAEMQKNFLIRLKIHYRFREIVKIPKIFHQLCTGLKFCNANAN